MAEKRMTVEEAKKLFDNAKGKRSDWEARVKEDRSLYNLDAYRWETTSKKHAPIDVDIITLNDPRVFADRVKDTCAGAKLVYEVEDGSEKIQDKKASPIERYCRLNFEAANERLSRAEMLPLEVAAAGHLTVTGRIVTRCLLRMEGKEYVPDIMWYDPLYTYYAPTLSGLMWAAPKLTKTAEQIWDEYQHEIEGNTGEVTDIWTRTDEHIYIDNKFFKTISHNLGYVPFVVSIAPIGGFLLDEGFSKYVGESVYAPVRNLYKVLNRLLTIEATTARLAMEGAYQYESKEGEQANVAEAGFPVEPGKVTAVELGGGYKLIPINDIKQATMHCISLIEARIQRATLPFIDYGQTPFDLSGSAMMMVKGAGDIIYAPRLYAMESLYTQLAKMIIKQTISGGLKVELGEGPYKMKFTKQDLSGDYSLKVKLVPSLPEKELSNFSRAAAAKELGISNDTIKRRYLEMDDPDGEKLKALRERAEDMIPALWMRDAARGEIQAEDNRAAKIIAAQLNVSLQQLLSGQFLAPQKQPSGNYRATNIPRLFEGSKGGKPIRQAEMPKMPQMPEKEPTNVK